MLYQGLVLCGHNLGRLEGDSPEGYKGYHRICYGKPGHRGGHGSEGKGTVDDPGQGELLLSDDELAKYT